MLQWSEFSSSSVEDLYESVSDREIRQVFEGQNQIHMEIKQLNRQLAMILDEQRRYVSVITEEISKRSGQAQSGQVRPKLNPERKKSQNITNTPNAGEQRCKNILC